jgi:hypothetical protein
MINTGASLSLIKIEAVEIAKIPRRRKMKSEATILIYMKQTTSSSIKIGRERTLINKREETMVEIGTHPILFGMVIVAEPSRSNPHNW